MTQAGVLGTPHSLRHYFGSSLVAIVVDLRTAQTMQRHTNLQTTATYVQADVQRAEPTDRLNPFGTNATYV